MTNKINIITSVVCSIYCKLTEISRSSFTVSFSPPAPLSGSNTELSCALKPWRHGVSVEWMLNNNPYLPQPKTGLHSDKVSRVLKVTEKERGTWTCVVTYKGERGQASAALDVKGEILSWTTDL